MYIQYATPNVQDARLTPSFADCVEIYRFGLYAYTGRTLELSLMCQIPALTQTTHRPHRSRTTSP